MDYRYYETHTEKFFKGKQVKSLFSLRNGYIELPAGTVYTITRKYQGFNLISTGCIHCGGKQNISRVSYRDIELLPKQPFGLLEE
jgi:hypothetical protein